MKLNIEQKRTLFEEGYKFCFDVVKLIIGGVILAGIMQENINKVILYSTGFIFIIFLLALGVIFIIFAKNKKK